MKERPSRPIGATEGDEAGFTLIETLAAFAILAGH